MRRLILIVLGVVVVSCSTTTVDPPTSVTEEIETTGSTADAISSGDKSADSAESDNDTLSAQDNLESEEEETTAMTTPEEMPPLAASDLDHAELLNQILLSQGDGPETLAQIRESGDSRFVAALIDTLRYRRDLDEDIGYTLNTLSGQNLNGSWFEWVEWAGQQSEITSFEGYDSWKANLFAQIDPNFMRFMPLTGVKVAPGSRVEEIVWGGVRVDGIPALDRPTMIDPEEADYLIANERVFGVSINGDTRAYPARFLDWHEMFNDIVGGEPVSLAY